MNLKTYQAKSMADALAEVKRDLGRDAVILHTRSFRKGGLFGLGGRPMWEITAAPGVNVPKRVKGRDSRGGDEGRYVATAATATGTADIALDVELDEELTALDLREESGDGAVLPMCPTAAAQRPAAPVHASPVTQQMAEIRRMVESLLVRQAKPQTPDIPPELVEYHAHLLAQDVAEDLAGEIIRNLRMGLTGQQLADRELIRARMLELVAASIKVAAPVVEPDGRARVIALIGPTGVGKTTTIAKLAANFKLREKKRVGLITIDTYRIAAVDQLRTYAEIIDVPLQTVLTAGELHQTVRSMRDLDVVLIDTAGRSQNDRLRLNQLRSFLSAAEADEVHLVVSSTANRKCAVNTLERFIPLGANRVIMTKLDEAATFGALLNISAAGKVDMSYVTAGQDVPEDILPADASRLAAWIVNGQMGESIHAS